MASETVSGIARPKRPPPWHDPVVRGVVFQILFVAAVVALGGFLVHNTLANLERQNIATGFGFLGREAAFGIGESLIPYSPADSYARAFLVGLTNTLSVAALGIVLATILGTVMGLARLSSNWLIAKLAQIYVETFRNIPLLLQLFFWWCLLHTAAPAPRQAWQILPDVFVRTAASSGSAGDRPIPGCWGVASRDRPWAIAAGAPAPSSRPAIPTDGPGWPGRGRRWPYSPPPGPLGPMRRGAGLQHRRLFEFAAPHRARHLYRQLHAEIVRAGISRSAGGRARRRWRSAASWQRMRSQLPQASGSSSRR